MATNAPAGDGQRKGMVRKRSQLKTKVTGEKRWTKRSRETGEFMDQKQDGQKFKGVRREGLSKAKNTSKAKATSKRKKKTKTRK